MNTLPMLFEAARFISIRTVLVSDSMPRAMAVRIYAALTSKFHRPDTGVLLRGYFDTTTPTNNFYNATDGPVAGGGQGDQRMVTPECDERYIRTMVVAVCV